MDVDEYLNIVRLNQGIFPLHIETEELQKVVQKNTQEMPQIRPCPYQQLKWGWWTGPWNTKQNKTSIVTWGAAEGGPQEHLGTKHTMEAEELEKVAKNNTTLTIVKQNIFPAHIEIEELQKVVQKNIQAPTL